MGRPRLYHSAEARLAANQAKSKRSYDKHKSAIAARRRQNRGTHKSESEQQHKSREKAHRQGKRAVEARDSIYWIKRCEHVAEKLATFTNGSASALLDSIYQKYAISRDQDVIDGAVARTTSFLTSICRYQDKLLQLSGVGPELEVANAVEGDVREINSWLEELLCIAMEGFNEVITTYCSRGFMFQQQ